MKSIPIAEIDSCQYLHCLSISEIVEGKLQAILEEHRSTSTANDITVSNEIFSGLRNIEHLSEFRTFEVTWPSYLGYSVRDESFTGGEKEDYIGKRFVLFSKSHYLDFIKKSTFADDSFPGPLKHWGIFCLDHVIDIVSTEDPCINLSQKSGTDNS